MENLNTPAQPKKLPAKVAEVLAVIEAGIPEAKWAKIPATLLFIGETEDTNTGLKSNQQVDKIKVKWMAKVDFIRQPLAELGFGCNARIAVKQSTNADVASIFTIHIDVNTAPAEITPAAPAATPASTPRAPKQPQAAGEKKLGVIATILDCIVKGNATQTSILEALEASFPEKTKESMLNTIKAQIGAKKQPTRMETEKGVEFVITDSGNGVRIFNIKK